MGNLITKKWYAELDRNTQRHRGHYTVKIFNEKHECIETIAGKSLDEVIDHMRISVSREVKLAYGIKAGHELQRSEEVKEGLFHIPVHVIDMSRSAYGGRPHNAEEIKKVTNVPPDLTQGTSVSMTPVPPVIPGYYWYSPDGTKDRMKIVSVVKSTKDEEEVWYVQDFDSYEVDDEIGDYKKKGVLWSKSPIKTPDIEESEEIKPVDHEDW